MAGIRPLSPLASVDRRSRSRFETTSHGRGRASSVSPAFHCGSSAMRRDIRIASRALRGTDHAGGALTPRRRGVTSRLHWSTYVARCRRVGHHADDGLAAALSVAAFRSGRRAVEIRFAPWDAETKQPDRTELEGRAGAREARPNEWSKKWLTKNGSSCSG